TDLNRVSGVVAALIADDDVEPLREQIDNLAFTFVAPLGAYDRYYHCQKQVYFRFEISNSRKRTQNRRGPLAERTKPRPRMLAKITQRLPLRRACRSCVKSRLPRWRRRRVLLRDRS